MYTWQNGTRFRDGVKVLWCRSRLVCPVFEGSIPTCACFCSEIFFVTLYLHMRKNQKQTNLTHDYIYTHVQM